MKIKSYLMAGVGFGILVGSIILAQPFVSHSQNQVPPIPVEVINTPLEIRSVDEAPACCTPKHPFRKFVQLVGPDGAGATSSDFGVPTGKRLVIENVSVLGFLPHGQQLQVGFSYNTPSFSMRQDFPVTFQLTDSVPPQDSFVSSQQMRVYVDSGAFSDIHLFAVRDSRHGEFIVDFSFSGFLVDLP